MANIYYGPGDHPAGFIGYRVVVAYDDNYLQKYFSTSSCDRQDVSDEYFRLQKLRAERQELDWEIQSLEHQYTRFVTTSHPGAREHAGVGVHGLTARFFVDKRGKWQAAFAVSQPTSDREARVGPKLFPFATTLYSKAWEKAVACWAKNYKIRKKDVERVLANPPPAEQFKHLRQEMNEDGLDVPIKALGHVFREQREALARARAPLQPAKPSEPTNPFGTAKKELEREMRAWFEEVSGVTP